MKPRLNLRYGIWAYYTLVPRVIGCGKSPAEAYREWKEQFSSSSMGGA